MVNFIPIMEATLFDKFHQNLPLTFSTFNKRKNDEIFPRQHFKDHAEKEIEKGLKQRGENTQPIHYS